jgi:hypothetical protein
MTTQHPITPPPELVQQWAREIYDETSCGYERDEYIAHHAAQWGADQELLACGNYLKQCAAWEEEDVIEFYNYRRPKPLGLKKQALQAINAIDAGTDKPGDSDIIRRALEQLND